jgi:hypothetical protein
MNYSVLTANNSSILQFYSFIVQLMFILSFGYFSFPRVESAGMFSSRSSSASFFIFVYPPVGKVCGLHSFWFFGLILGFSARSFCARLCAREGFRSQLVFIS